MNIKSCSLFLIKKNYRLTKDIYIYFWLLNLWIFGNIIINVRTYSSIAFNKGSGPDAKPMRIPADKILERLSNLRTRPTSGSCSSSAKYDGYRGASP